MQNFSADDLHRTTVYDRDGNKIGKVQQVYLDDDSGQPSWVTVNTGLFGTNESLIPLDGARLNDDLLTVPFDKQVIKDAPNFDPGHHLDESDENTLYDYYGASRPAGDDDRTVADRVMDRDDRIGDRTEDRGVAEARLRDQDRVPAQDSVREPGGTAGAATAGGVGGLAAAAAAGRDTRADTPNQDPAVDDHERELLERERDLLKRERDLLDRDRQLLERERQQGGRPRLRRHDPGQR